MTAAWQPGLRTLRSLGDQAGSVIGAAPCRGLGHAQSGWGLQRIGRDPRAELAGQPVQLVRSAPAQARRGHLAHATEKDLDGEVDPALARLRGAVPAAQLLERLERA